MLASLLVHGALLWPDLARRPAGPERPRTVMARLAPAPAIAAEPERAAPAMAKDAAGAASVRRADLAGRPETGPQPVPRSAGAMAPGPSGAPSEGAVRALRYALARELAGGVLPDLSGLPPTFTVAVHLRARRVVDVTLSGTGGPPALAAALRSAFKTAAQKAVIPDALPAEGFSVELELEAGDAERPDHDRPHLPG